MDPQADSTGEKKSVYWKRIQKKVHKLKLRVKKVRKYGNECMSICDRVKRSKGCNSSPRREILEEAIY